MAAPALTHAELAIKLVVEGALPILEGKTPSNLPVEGTRLTEEEAEKAGADPKALVVFYPIGDTGVFMQMQGNRMSAWYVGIDCDGVVAALEQSLRDAYPLATFTEQQTHSQPGMNVRRYHVPIDGKRFANVEATYPIDRRTRQHFIVRVHALEAV